MSGVWPGIVDLLVEAEVGVPQVQINMDRQAAAAVGFAAKQPLTSTFNGHAASQVLKSGGPTTCWFVSTIQRVSQSKQSVTRSSMLNWRKGADRPTGSGARRPGTKHNQP